MQDHLLSGRIGMARYALTAAFVFLTAGCQTIRAPEERAPPAPPPTLPDSGVSVSIAVDLGGVQTALSAGLPKLMDSGSETINVPANIMITTPMDITVDVVSYVPHQIQKMVPKQVSKVCQKKILKVILFPCTAVEMINVTETVMDKVVTPVKKAIDKATAVKSPVNVDLKRDIYLDSLSFAVQGNQLVVKATVGYDIDVKADAKIVKVGLTSCGIGDPRPELTLTDAIHVHWSDNGKLMLDKEPWTIEWTKPCNLTFADISLQSVLRISGLQHQIDDAIDQAMSKIPAQIDLATMFDGAFRFLDEPKQLIPQVWLVAAPTGADISDPYGEGQTLQLGAEVLAHPVISYGDEPKVTLEAPPQLIHTKIPDEFTVELEGAASFDSIDRLLTSKYVGAEQQVMGHTVAVSAIKSYASGSFVVVAVTVKKPFRATLYLTGTPTFDSSAKVMNITGLDYTAETNAFLLKAADWLLHSTFKDALQSVVTKSLVDRSLAPYFADATAALTNFQKTVEGTYGGVHGSATLAIHAPTLSVENIFLSADAIHARVLVHGKASVTVQ
jgi:Domain of unknown function (DUF4403)